MPGSMDLLALAAAVLIAAAFIPVLVRRTRTAGILVFALTTVSCAAIAAASIAVLTGEGKAVEAVLSIGGSGVPFVLDGLSAVFLILLVVLAFTSGLFSIRFSDNLEGTAGRRYFAFLPLFILTLIGLLTVDDLGLGFTMTWQLMVVSSYFLIRTGSPDKGTKKSALVYLGFMEAAWALIVTGPFFIGGYAPGDSLAAIGGKLASAEGPAVFIFFAFLFLGFGIKTGVFPFGRMWMPGAYASAPAPAGALMAGVLEKTGVFGLIRIFMFTAAAAGSAFDGRFWGLVFLVFGALTLFIGTIQAIKQSDYFRLLAFSSIGQVGYILFAMGAALIAAFSGEPAIAALAPFILLGGLYHAVNHGVFKGALFLTAGSMYHATGTKDLNRLGGLLKVMPLTGAAAAVFSYAISGMPASSGFNSKWMMISGGLLSGRGDIAVTVCSIAALFTSALTLACYVKFFGLSFTSAGSQWRVKRTIREVPLGLLIPNFLLAAVCLTQAFMPSFYVDLLSRAMSRSGGSLFSAAFSGRTIGRTVSSGAAGVTVLPPGPGAVLAAASPFFLAALLLFFGFAGGLLRRSGGSREVNVPTWLCGYQDLSSDNSYLDRNMFGDLKKAFRWAGADPEKKRGKANE